MKKYVVFYGKSVATIVFAIVFLCISHFSNAQNRWSFEVRPGVNIPTHKLGDINLNMGYGAEGVFAYQVMPHLGLYAGWSWNKFGSDQKLNETSLDFEETGYTYGIQFIHPIGDSKINLLARIGGLANHIEVEEGDKIISDTGHGFGWQVEGGLAVPLGKKWNLLPSVRFRSLERDLEIENTSTAVDLNYLSLGVGISRTF